MSSTCLSRHHDFGYVGGSVYDSSPRERSCASATSRPTLNKTGWAMLAFVLFATLLPSASLATGTQCYKVVGADCASNPWTLYGCYYALGTVSGGCGFYFTDNGVEFGSANQSYSSLAVSSWPDNSGTVGTVYGDCNACPSTLSSCTFNGQTVNSGSSVTAYQSNQALQNQGQSCVSQSRTCTNGTLSGSYQYSSCTLVTPELTPVTFAMLGAFTLLMGWWVRRHPGQAA